MTLTRTQVTVVGVVWTPAASGFSKGDQMSTTMQLETIPEPVAEPAAVLTEKDVAGLLNLSRDTVRAMQLGPSDLPYTQLADGRIRYRMADVLKYQALRSAAHVRLMESYGRRYAQ